MPTADRGLFARNVTNCRPHRKRTRGGVRAVTNARSKTSAVRGDRSEPPRASPLVFSAAFGNTTVAGDQDSPLAVLILNDFTGPETYTIVASWVPIWVRLRV